MAVILRIYYAYCIDVTTFFLRLFAPRMLPKMNINSNKGKIALGKKETFRVLKGTHFVW